MTRYEAIDLAFKIEKDPQNYTDYSTYLYSAVGLIKREPGTGSTMAAQKLVDAIKGTGAKLSDFCERRIHIIEEAHVKNMCKSLERLVKAQEICDYNQQCYVDSMKSGRE